MIKYFLALLIPAFAFAQPDLRARVVVLTHPSWPQGFITSHGLQVTIAGAEYLHSLHGGRSFKVVDVKHRRDPAPAYDELSKMGSRFFAIRASRLHKRMRRGVGFVYYVASPMRDPYGSWFMGGVAGGFCKRRSLLAMAMGQARDFNERGDSRLVQSQIIMAHEMGHLMDMRHVSSPTLMNGNALTLSVLFKLIFNWDPINIAQQRQCLG